MGLFDRILGQRSRKEPEVVSKSEIKGAIAAAAKNDVTITFNDKNITYTGD